MSRYVNRSLADYVPVSQYMGTLGMTKLPYVGDNLGPTQIAAQKGIAVGVAVGTIGTLVACMIYNKVKGRG